MDGPVCSVEPLGSEAPVWVEEPVCSGEPLGSEEPVCSVWLVGSLWLCCAAVLGWLAGASVPPVLVVLLLDPAAEPLFGLEVLAPEAAALIVWTFAARARVRLDLRQLLERAVTMRAARALPPRCWPIRLLIIESICDPAPIGPGG